MLEKLLRLAFASESFRQVVREEVERELSSEAIAKAQIRTTVHMLAFGAMDHGLDRRLAKALDH